MNFDKIDSSIIDLNIGSNLDNLFEYYKSLIFKIIFSCESTNYKIFEKKSTKNNLKNYSSNFIISDYFEKIFKCIEHDGFNSDIDNITFEIIKLTSDTRNLINLKIFYLIDNFYKYLDREQLKIYNYENYKNSLIKIFNEYYKYNTVEIYNIITDKDFNFETNFKLTLKEF